MTVLAAALTGAPGLVSALALAVILVPSPLLRCHCVSHGPGHPHLCLLHPWLATPVVPWAAPIVLAWLVFAGVRVTISQHLFEKVGSSWVAGCLASSSLFHLRLAPKPPPPLKN